MSYKIVISGGGTGGHLFPGIALAQNLPKDNTLFLCTQRPFDSEQLKKYGFNHKVLSSPRLSISIRFILDILKAIKQAKYEINEFRPDFVLGLGGYGSIAPIIVAKMRNIPVILLEQNLLPGKVTDWVSSWAKIIACQWKGTGRYLSNRINIQVTGSPVRSEVKKIDKGKACEKLGIDKSKKVLSIIGGSQGAKNLNKFIIDNMDILASYKDKIAVLHLSGEHEYANLKESYEKSGLNYYLREFSDDMAFVYSASDLVMARAGGITIAEITALGIPAVLIPYPFAAENHQYINALEFAQNGAGRLIVQKELSKDKIKRIIEEILLDASLLRKMSESSLRMGSLESAKELLKLISQSK